MLSKNRILKKKFFIPIIFFGVSVFFVFSPAFKASFSPWDDKEYTIENPDIKSFSVEHVKNIFSTAYLGNYQPITMISYAFDYFLKGDDAFIFHFMNLLFHVANGILVFILLIRFLKNNWIALLCASIFLLHPIQSETVMWIAERKNLLYVFFFLIASISYLNFQENKKKYSYFLTLFFFCLSLMSKATAVTFPLCLFVFDLMLGEKISKKNFIQKIPFFILSILVGLFAIHFQEQGGYLNTDRHIDFFTKILYGCHAYCFYFLKTIAPFSLSCYYPYPEKTGFLESICVLIVLCVVAGVYYLIKKKRNIEAGGILFFTFNIIFVLQFIPFGKVLVAERYNYLGCIGLLLFFSGLTEELLKLKLNSNLLPKIVGTLLVFMLSCITYSRNKIWENSIIFYNDILKKFPDSYIVLSSLGAEFTKENKFDTAEKYFAEAIKKNPKDNSVYYNLGLCYLKQNKIEMAYDAFSISLEIKTYYKALFARATILEQTKQFERAIEDLDTAIKQKPSYGKALYLRALCRDEMGNAALSLTDYTSAIAIENNEPLYYLNRAIAYGKLNRISESITDLDMAINLNPNYAQAYYIRAIGKNKRGENPCFDLKKADVLGCKDAKDAIKKICK